MLGTARHHVSVFDLSPGREGLLGALLPPWLFGQEVGGKF